MSKTIAIFSGYYPPSLGGVERYTNKLMLEMQKIGYNVIIITSRFDSSLKEYEICEDGFEIFRLPVYNLFKNRYPILKKNEDYKRIMQELDKKDIDFIICQTRFHLTSLQGLKLAKRKDIPSIVIEHGSDHFTVGNKVLDFSGAIYEHMLTWRIKKLNNNFYAVSKRSSKWLEHFNIRSKGEIYNSVDGSLLEDFKDKSFYIDFGDKIVITYAGRILKEKGVEMLLEAFISLDNQDKIELVIAGDGPILNDLESKYKEPNITFVGKLDYETTMSLLNITDIFCYPSMYPEGLPTSILEAGLMKCAIVATDRGGTVEVINDPKYGTIIKENKDSLKRALEKLISDKELISEQKNSIHDRVNEKYTWQITARRVEDVIERNS